MNSHRQLTSTRQRGMSTLKVLGIVFIVFVLICGGIVTYVVRNARSMMVSAMRGPMITMINETQLPDDQKTRLTDTVNNMMDDFESGAMSMKQAGQIMVGLTEGPFFNLINVEMLRAKHQETIDLEDEERTEVTMTFDRFQRGIYEEEISDAKMESVLDKVSKKDPNGEPMLKENLTEEELTDAVEKMKKAADEADIPKESYQVDFASELQRVIDEACGTASQENRIP